MIESSNPALKKIKKNSFGMGESLTVQGVINKTIILFAIMLLSGYAAINYIGIKTVASMMWPLLIVNMIVAFTYIFKPNLTFLAPIYAITEGMLLSAISISYETMYPGIVTSAITGTIVSFATMLFLYKARIIQATQGFKKFIMVSLLSIIAFYLVSIVLSLFGVSMALVHGSSMLSIGISVFIVAIASLSFILDFDRIEEAANSNTPVKMEYYLAFGLMISIVWLYLEMLRLLAKLRDR